MVTDTYLYTPTVPFDFQNPQEDIAKLIAKMNKILKEKNGLGIAANQIGYNFSAFMISDNENTIFFNPKIVDKSISETMLLEGCISFPGIFLNIKRSDKIRIRFQDINGEVQTKKFNGITAHVIQHEMDHLEGKVFLDKVSRAKKELSIRKAKAKNAIG